MTPLLKRFSTRKKTCFIYIALIVVLLFQNVAISSATTTTSTTNSDTEDTNNSTDDSWPKGPSVTSASAIVMDANTGLILYDKNSTKKHYPASITKILTSLVAIENASLSDVVTFSNDAIFNVDLDSSRVGINVGEKLTLEQCLYAIMLSSANEVSYAVAEHVGGTVDNFVKMMNERAKELGCTNSNFVNPHGLHNENHSTCARDMALIAQAAIKNTTFAKITGTRTFTIPPTNLQKESRPLANHHKFIQGDMPFEGAIGGKTGYTSNAKYTLVTYAKRGDMELICVVMAAESSTSQYTDTAALLNFGFDNFSIYNISGSSNNDLIEDSPFFTKYSSLLNTTDSLLSTGSDGFVVLPNSVDLSKATREVVFNPITELVEGDNTIGSVTYKYQDKIVGQTDIIYHNKTDNPLPVGTVSNLKSSGASAPAAITSTKKSIFKKIFNPVVIVILVILIILGLLYYFFIELPRLRRRRAYYRRRQHQRRNRY